MMPFRAARRCRRSPTASPRPKCTGANVPACPELACRKHTRSRVRSRGGGDDEHHDEHPRYAIAPGMHSTLTIEAIQKTGEAQPSLKIGKGEREGENAA